MDAEVFTRAIDLDDRIPAGLRTTPVERCHRDSRLHEGTSEATSEVPEAVTGDALLRGAGLPRA